MKRAYRDSIYEVLMSTTCSFMYHTGITSIGVPLVIGLDLLIALIDLLQ